jgi:DNA-binding CsgD family transcriptional regulator
MDKKKSWMPVKHFSIFWLVSVLTVYFFVFLLSELIINDHAAVELGSSSVVTNYSIGIIFTGLGYLTFALSRGVFAQDVYRRSVLGVFGLLYLGSMFAVLFIVSSELFTIFTCICTLSMGYMGGFIHYHAAVALQGSNYTGRVVGISYFSAISLQYVVQYFAVTETALMCCIAAGVGLLFSVILRPPCDWLFENPLPYERAPTATQKELWMTALIVALMSALVGIYDGATTGLHASGKLDLAGWPRLMLAVGELLAGLLYDLRKRVYMPLFALCTTLFLSLSIVFLYTNPTPSMALYYFCGGFYVVYFTIAFIDLAPRTSNPALWAGMGRVFRSFFVGLTAVPSEWLFAETDQNAVIAINVLVFTVLLFLFWHKGDLISTEPVKPEDGGVKRKMGNFAAKYQFTPREAEIMEKILLSDKGVKELAAEINISERVLYRYFNSLYEKTGTTYRIGLLLLYYGSGKPIENVE